MQVRIPRNAGERWSLLVYAVLGGFAVLLGGCGDQRADTNAGPDEDNSAVATLPEDVKSDGVVPKDVVPKDGIDGGSVGTVPDVRAKSDALNQPAELSAAPEPTGPRKARAAAPYKMEAMTKHAGEKMGVEESPVVEPREEAMVARSAMPEAETGADAPQTSTLRADKSREQSEQAYAPVTVFYATDRKQLDASADGVAWGNDMIPLVAAAAVTLCLVLLGYLGWRRRLTLGLSVVGLLATLALGVQWGTGSWSQFQQTADPGVRYGNERGTLVYGTCDVTIPASHSSGEVERPSILRLEVREDATKHVVLQATEPKAKDDFFRQLRTTVEAADRSEVFVFVHGYNVTFDGAARRTAQIAHDVGFSGAPIFFSWPSQGGLLKYTVDENNVEWAVPHLKQFLIDVSRQSGAESVNLIAHSMGNQALTGALRELQRQLGEETALFNQVILAAPDVDAEIFRRDLAPALVQSARRVTLYASSNDQALVASKKVHGHARAGDSGAGLVVVPGIETIDVSTLDTSLLGHSYYGSSDPILLDIRGIVHEALPAAQRPFLLPRSYGGLTYWVFEKMRATATRSGSQLQ